MNREIKFRAWRTVEQRMVRSNQAIATIMRKHILGYPEPGLDGQGGDYNGHTKETDHILMQYTGLKDKNGTEIFEGDIVEEKVPGKVYRKTEVKWNRSDLGFYFYNSGTDFIEVIGNIYENPDLIK